MTDLEKLRQFINERHMTQTELGRRLGYKSPTYMNKVFAGQIGVTGEMKWRFAQAFGAETAANLFTPDEDLAA